MSRALQANVTILDESKIDIDHFEGAIAVGRSIYEIQLMFGMTRKELEDWVAENYPGMGPLQTVYERIKADMEAKLGTVSSGCTMNSSLVSCSFGTATCELYSMGYVFCININARCIVASDGTATCR